MAGTLSRRVERHGLTTVAVCFALGAVVENLISPQVTIGAQSYDRGPDGVIVAASLAVALLVGLRERIGIAGPLAGLGTIGVAALPAPAWVLDSAFVFLLGMLVCGICGYLPAGRAAAAGPAMIWVVAGVAEWRHPDRTVTGWLLVGAFMTISWAVGLLVRRPVVQARSAEDRALRLEREQAEAAERAVHEERQRIARELHDIIAHSVSVMTVQAGAVRRLLRADQVRERVSLLSVEETGRDALAEMRRLVGLLKEDDAAPAYSPQPGMQSLDALITTVREAGLPVDFRVQGQERDLPPGLDLTAFRVVQEALTNALKHAGPARAQVTVRWAVDELEIEVANDGQARRNGASSGYGSAGMRERVTLYGGRLESGPGAEAGYVVRAVLPLAQPA